MITYTVLISLILCSTVFLFSIRFQDVCQILGLSTKREKITRIVCSIFIVLDIICFLILIPLEIIPASKMNLITLMIILVGSMLWFYYVNTLLLKFDNFISLVNSNINDDFSPENKMLFYALLKYNISMLKRQIVFSSICVILIFTNIFTRNLYL